MNDYKEYLEQCSERGCDKPLTPQEFDELTEEMRVEGWH